jgi:hypothetical protein
MEPNVVTYPTRRVEDLSTDAWALHSTPLDVQGRLRSDPFLPVNEACVARRSREDYRPSQRVLAAAAELASAGLGSFDADRAVLRAERLHPQYTVARGVGRYLAQVRLAYPGNPGRDPVSDQWLAALIGADFDDSAGGSGGVWRHYRLQTLHPAATDIEHDASRTAVLEIVNPVMLSLNQGVMTWAGTLTDIRLYPFGVDPLTVDDRDTRAGQCEGQQKHFGPDHADHPLAPYQPSPRPETEDLVGRTVRIDLYPIVAFDVA